MNLVDLAILAIIGVSLAVGLFRGFIREILSLASWIVALWSAYLFALPGAVYLEPYISQTPFRVVAAFVIIFVLILIAASFIGYLLYRMLSFGGISGIDRSLGMLFGVGRGVVIVGLLLLAAVFMDLTSQSWWQGAQLTQHFQPVTEMLRSLMPADLAAYFQINEQTA